jgi:hypothetical protein
VKVDLLKRIALAEDTGTSSAIELFSNIEIRGLIYITPPSYTEKLAYELAYG